MYPTTRQLADLALQRQQSLLGEAARARLIRGARPSRSVPSLTSGSLRGRLTTGVRALAAWIGARTSKRLVLAVRTSGAA